MYTSAARAAGRKKFEVHDIKFPIDMATSAIAAMLDELMGRNRNVGPDENAKELEWSDPEVCRYYVVNFCPHELFTNTKADLGPCNKIHDDELKRKFHEEKESYKKSQITDEFFRFAQRMLNELETRIRKARERLLLTQEALDAPGNEEVKEKIELLSDKITQLVDEAEAAGTEGNVEQAQGLMKLCDQLREERDELKRSVMPVHPRDEYGQHQKAMEVCETCGAFLIVGDAQQRIEDHLMGKQHVGYARLRAAVAKIIEEKKKQREEREKELEERRKMREAEHQKEMEERQKRRESSEKRRESSEKQRRESSERRNSRRRSRSRDRRRSRSRDRKRRSRSRDRRRRSRSRERRRRSRSRSKDRKRRSRSRERSRRSRSRDRRDD